jgi:hypothetical protein
MITPITRVLVLLASLLLTACAASSLPGFQNAYYSYNVPQPLFDSIKVKFREHGLDHASITRDTVGRVQLTGSYRNEDEVDTAFTIVQSIVGLKSTSPFYPQDIKQKRWDIAAGKALDAYNRSRKAASLVPTKRALVIGINSFRNQHIGRIQGRDDAVVVQGFLKRAGYSVTTLLEEQATKANIEHALVALDNAIGPNDTVFVYISSHGTPPLPTAAGGDQRKMSIIAYDSGYLPNAGPTDNTESRLFFQQTSVPDTLVQSIAQKPSRTTRLIIDTCYSGDMLNDVQDDPSAAYILKTNGGEPERAGISLASWTGPAYTSKGIHFAADPTSAKGAALAGSSLASTDRSRSGYTIITATSENEESLGPDSKIGTFPSPLSPDRQLRGSFFTQSLFDYLGKYNGELGLAFRDARGFTSETATKVTEGKDHQVPREFSTIPDQQNNLFD